MASWLCCSSLPSVYQRLGISILRGGHESLLKWSQTFGFMSEDLYFIRVKIIHTRFFYKNWVVREEVLFLIILLASFVSIPGGDYHDFA